MLVSSVLLTYSLGKEKIMDKDKLIIAILFILFAIGFFTYKYFAPQSGFRSRILGKAVSLPMPKDCDPTRPIFIGRGDKVKYISYYDKAGNPHMKEFSDWGILQAHYTVTLKRKK